MRGADSRGVIDLLATLPRTTFLRGNHDDVLDLLLNGECYICHPTARERLVAFKWFMQHGLAETLMSYGADSAELESVVQSPSPEALAQGRALYETFCLVCHGEQGRGDGPLVPKIPNPPAYTSARVRARSCA